MKWKPDMKDFKYIIFILTLVIVALLTIIFGKIEIVLSHLGFAATVSSIILALVTIFYSLSQSTSASEYFGKIDKALLEIQKVYDGVHNIQKGLNPILKLSANDSLEGGNIDISTPSKTKFRLSVMLILSQFIEYHEREKHCRKALAIKGIQNFTIEGFSSNLIWKGQYGDHENCYTRILFFVLTDQDFDVQEIKAILAQYFSEQCIPKASTLDYVILKETVSYA